MSDLYGAVNLMEVIQLFQILGTANISNIAIDNIYLTGGGTAAPDVAPSAGPDVDAGPDKIVRSGNSVSITGIASSTTGTVESYLWTVVSGPNSPALTGNDTETVMATGLVTGTYVFRLTATDNDEKDNSDEVTVFVGPNLAPTANAGADKTLSLPASSIGFEGTGNDTDGTITTYSWTQTSGPNAAVITNASAATTTVSGLIQGSYEFKLTVTDNEGASGFDLVKVEVTANSAPTAHAGEDKIITLPTNSVSLAGSGDDTGIIAGFQWTVVSGPSTPTIGSATAANTEVNNLIEGTYVFELKVTDDGGLFDTDEVTVTVNPAPINLALLKLVTVSSTENGTTPASGAVDGNLTTRWSSAFSDPQWISVDLGDTYAVDRVKITWEPAYGKDYTVEISDDNDHWAVMKTVTGNTALVNEHLVSGEGRYIRIHGTARGTQWGYSIYELEVYGQSASGHPVVNAGADVTITLPTNEVTIEGEASNPGSEIATYEWTVVSGPNTPTLTGAGTASLTASNLVEGTYVFWFVATDINGLSGSDDVSVIVKSVTGIEEQSERSVKCYPNPAKTILKIEGIEENSRVYITSSTGMRVGAKVVADSSIDVTALPPGIYILSFDGLKLTPGKFSKE
jgi:hypothetical protein